MPAARLAAFRAAILARTKVAVATVTGGEGPVAKGSYVDRFGTKLEKTFQGEATIDGQKVDYDRWPLVDNLWIHQEWEGNMRITDGVTERLYDVKNWTITERKVSR